ncbi:hypothetical protein KBB12_04505 [Candidatus Woesebacteria bacterium]|nr:hypothetical protein [Candidatus Woesebacteria bacterium]
MRTKKKNALSKHIRDTVIHTVRTNDSRITELFETAGHFGVLLIAFFFVIVLFLWKEGKARTDQQNTNKPANLPQAQPTTALKDVPPADVGMRMIFDQANGELGTNSAELATVSASMLDNPSPSKESENLPKLDLQGPWSCSTITDGGTAKLYIQNNKVRFTNGAGERTENTLLSGDCLYTWAANTGTKQCGFSQYMDLFSSLLPGSEGIDIDIGSIIEEQMGGDENQSKAFTSLRQSCQKGTINSSIFVAPSSVEWDESTTDDSGILDLFQ